MKQIPTQLENQTGLHQRYRIQKIVPASKEFIEQQAVIHETTNNPNASFGQIFVEPEFMLEETQPGSEYFVMRLDEGGKDREHIKACRMGVHAYANAIEHHLPELAKDLRERYPLLA